MEIRVRLHPRLRAELRKLSKKPHEYRSCLARIAAEARRLVERHGDEIVHAAIDPFGAPLNGSACAVSAFRSRHGAVVIDVDPIGTALGDQVVVPKPFTVRVRRIAKLAGGARHTGYTASTLRLGAKH